MKVGRRGVKRRRRRKLFLGVGLGFIVIGMLMIIIYWFISYNPGKLIINGPFNLGTYEFDRASLSGKEQDIAWKLYVQLTTRKAAIPIDEENDIIIEVYDSWYQLFTSTRDYLIELPAHDLEDNENAQEIVKFSTDVLNQGLRPHLTKWQGKFRKWYDDALNDPSNKELSPQEIQKKYIHYDDIMEDMKSVNKELSSYAKELKRFSHEKSPSFSTRTVSWLKGIWEQMR